MMQEDYYSPNSSEKKLIAENKAFAERAISLAYKAGAISSLFYLRFGDGDDSDAFRHCLWAALIAKETDVSWAQRWTDAHEDTTDNNSASRERIFITTIKGLGLS